MPRRPARVLAAIAVSLLLGSTARAQAPDPPTPTPSIERDQAVVNVPTTLPLGRHHSYFRITHRFTRDLRRGSVGELSEELFGLDSGAIIGLEYRFGVTSDIQAGVHRSILGKTIVVFGKWDAVQQSEGGPFGLSILPSIEGQNNLQVDPQPGIAATISRGIGSWLVLYANPTYIHHAHTGTLRAAHEGHEDDVDVSEEDADLDSLNTAFIGLGARARIRPSVVLVVEVSPRLGGYTPGVPAWNAGIEKLTRGHVLQLNFGNNFDSTPGMIARGGNEDQVYLGFNLSRRW
jgi:hypothetical protein